MWRFRAQKSTLNTLQSPELQDLNSSQCAGKKLSTAKTLLRPPTRRTGFLSRCASNLSCVNPQTVSIKQNKITMPSISTKSPVKCWNLMDSPVYSRDLTTKDPPKEMGIDEEEWYHRIKDPKTSATLEFLTPCLCQLSGVLSNAEIPDKSKAELSAALETRWSQGDTSKMEKSVIELVYDMAKKKVLKMRPVNVIRTSQGSICAILDKFSLTSNSAANKDFENTIENLGNVWHDIEGKMHLEQMPSHGGWFEEWNMAVPGQFYHESIEHEILLLGKRLGNPMILRFFYNLTKDLLVQPEESRSAYYEKKREEFLKGLQEERDVGKSTETTLRRTYALLKELRNMLHDVDEDENRIHAPIEFFEEENNKPEPEVHASTFRTLGFRSISMPTNLRNSPSSST
ncbi:uncharacterized protein MELLADRAFT_86046 [Melampsora larici-populina 98AG31]|uniref:Uncharacterized protein n=1 Tax=Melampsora larici-populina (strain 98AG31 / pathotype 3-4-7) TaxID=747676 RepID=F4RKK2_MELLP|nr:uncharacterized protein MELLADRAFT_86046 [Melampsora larici-populina 98AG31]EGG07108.1 hypothetical protein MELLADRAFT_86046 [Melampsora larici-populina 98AG31]